MINFPGGQRQGRRLGSGGYGSILPAAGRAGHRPEGPARGGDIAGRSGVKGYPEGFFQ